MAPRSVVNIQEAKTHLSRLVDRAAAGEEIVVARNGRPVARLVALDASDAPRQGGWARGEIAIGADFDAPLPDDVQAAFEGRR
jgi:prevent-host-death family protein